MSWQSHIDIFLSALGLIGTLLIGAGILKSTPDIRGEISMTKYGYNSCTIDSVSSQKADFEVGISVLLLTFLLKIASSWFANSLSNLFLQQSLLPCAYSALVIIGLIAYLTSLFLARLYKLSTKRAIFREIMKQKFRHCENKSFPQEYYKGTLESASDLLGIKKDHNTKAQDFIETLCKEVGLIMPSNLDFSKIEEPTE